MDTSITVKPKVKQSALAVMAETMNVEPAKLFETLKQTCFKGANDTEMLALVVVANTYGLNPLVKHIYAFPGKGGGIVPVVSVDGWIHLMNRAPNFDGIEFAYEQDEHGKPISCTSTIHLKDRSHPVKVTEFYDECFRNTDPWTKMPARMLRNKALIQGARVAFGFSGIYDEDEANDQNNLAIKAEPLPANCEAVSPAPARQIEAPAPSPTPAAPVEVLPREDKPPLPQDPEAPKSAAAFAAVQEFMEGSGIPEAFIIECCIKGKLIADGARTLQNAPAGLLEMLAGKELQARILNRWNTLNKKEGK